MQKKYGFVVLLFYLYLSFSLQGQDTQGFFLDDFQPKKALIPPFVDYQPPVADPATIVTIQANDTRAKVAKYIFGNNANVYMGQMVDQPDLLNHIKTLSPNIIRFPGGNLSSVFFWDAPKDQLPADVPHYAAEWVRYDQGRTRFWEIGNENAGTWQAGYRIDTRKNKDGQPEIISGELYGQHFKIFADSMRAAAAEIGSVIYIGAQLIQTEPAGWATQVDKTWNAGLFKSAGNAADFFIVHSYYTPYGQNSTPDQILSTPAPESQAMMAYNKAEFTGYFN